MQKVFHSLYTCHRFLILCEKVLLCLILFAMIGFSFSQVVARNLFSLGFIWVDIFLRHGVIWVAFLGASLATEYGQHIKIDVLSHVMSSQKAKNTVDITINMFQIFICILLLAGSIEYVLMLKKYPTYIFSFVPVWGLRMIVPCSFFMMILSCLFYIGNTLMGKETPSLGYETVDVV